MISMFYNDVMNIDCSVFDPQRGPRGVSYAVSLELKGELGPEGVIVDFSLAKKKAKEIIDREIDHRFIVFDNQGTLTPRTSGTGLIFKGSYQDANQAPASM
ncbi:MAG: 6-carboxytetrahydropterin synthase, partial [Bacteriovoracaceae bacterium]|nr:6-carboxytetrahydropterin synthase [Bacteriovoracaceae bacterium]